MSANRTTRSNKLTRSLKKKQKALQVVGHKIVHDELTRCFQHGGQVLWATLRSLCTPGGELQILSPNAQKTQTSPTLKQWGRIYLLWVSLQMLWSNSLLCPASAMEDLFLSRSSWHNTNMWHEKTDKRWHKQDISMSCNILFHQNLITQMYVFHMCDSTMVMCDVLRLFPVITLFPPFFDYLSSLPTLV